jgi:indolepyruvate ferredoxin oxidoreductase beta subunit
LTIDSADIARSLGSLAVQNIVMLGALVATEKVPVKLETVRNSIRAAVSEKFVEINLKAFEAGYKRVLGR